MVQPHNRHMSFSLYISALAESDTIVLLVGKNIYILYIYIYIYISDVSKGCVRGTATCRHAGSQEVGRCRTRGEHYVHLQQVRIKLPTLALKPSGDVTRSPKQEYQWSHKKDMFPP